jgi:hypothetical protein
VSFRVLAAPALAAALVATPGPGAEVVDPETARLARTNEALTRLAELADGGGFYLVLEPDSARLSLMLEGAVLREYVGASLEVAVPRVLFRRRADPLPEWRERIWRAGELDPPRRRDRIEITAVPPDPERPEGSVEIPVPPLAEEAILVPDRYFVRFADGLTLEIRPTKPPRGLPWELSWQDGLAALGWRGPSEPFRLRLHLEPANADALYRSLPPSVDLIILPSGMQAAHAQ